MARVLLVGADHISRLILEHVGHTVRIADNFCKPMSTSATVTLMWTIFSYLAYKRHRHIPDHIEWRMRIR